MKRTAYTFWHCLATILARARGCILRRSGLRGPQAHEAGCPLGDSAASPPHVTLPHHTIAAARAIGESLPFATIDRYR